VDAAQFESGGEVVVLRALDGGGVRHHEHEQDEYESRDQGGSPCHQFEF
jgi:hypothetical protein